MSASILMLVALVACAPLEDVDAAADTAAGDDATLPTASPTGAASSTEEDGPDIFSGVVLVDRRPPAPPE